jgi:hypothetical protein
MHFDNQTLMLQRVHCLLTVSLRLLSTRLHSLATLLQMEALQQQWDNSSAAMESMAADDKRLKKHVARLQNQTEVGQLLCPVYWRLVDSSVVAFRMLSGIVAASICTAVPVALLLTHCVILTSAAAGAATSVAASHQQRGSNAAAAQRHAAAHFRAAAACNTAGGALAGWGDIGGCGVCLPYSTTQLSIVVLQITRLPKSSCYCTHSVYYPRNPCYIARLP